MRPPIFNVHAEHVADYITKLGLFGLTQEIRFALNANLAVSDPLLHDKIIDALNDFQLKLHTIQKDRINEAQGVSVLPIGVVPTVAFALSSSPVV